MTIHITFENGSNPYILSGNPEAIAKELSKWFKAFGFEVERIDDTSLYLRAYEISYLSVHPLTDYEKNKATARELAYDYSCKVGESVQSWQVVSEFYAFFETLGKRFGLIREFQENAIA